MPNQDITIKRSTIQNSILELEKKYFSRLDTIVNSSAFQTDLRLIENEIQMNYSTLDKTWEIKNKIKVAAERLVRHHVYLNFITDIKGIYESPLSSDLGIELADCILCIDCKTYDTETNKNDIRYTSVERNQTSFDNSKHKYIPTESNLEKFSRRSNANGMRLPVLTYVIKIIYRDDNTQFNVSRTTNIGGKPSIILVNIPNGELSNLFDKDIIVNFKTYKYYKESHGVQYAPVPLPKKVKKKTKWTERYCSQQGFSKVVVQQDRGTKDIYLDAANQCSWTLVSNSIRAIKCGDSMRFDNSILKDRYDSQNAPWLGYKEFDI